MARKRDALQTDEFIEAFSENIESNEETSEEIFQEEIQETVTEAPQEEVKEETIESKEESVINIGDIVEIFGYHEEEFNGLKYKLVRQDEYIDYLRDDNGPAVMRKGFIRKV